MYESTSKKLRKAVFYLISFVLCFCILFPLFWGVSSSFRTNAELFQYSSPISIHTFIPVNFTLESYVRVFEKFGFGVVLQNSIIVTLITVILGIIINSLAAFAFANFEFPGKKVLFSIVLVSFMIPFESVAIPLYKIASTLGWQGTLHGMIIPCIANGLVLFLFTQFFSQIPKDFYESAHLDGASWLTIFIRIVIPLSVPVVITAGLMIFVSQWNSYLWPLLVGGTSSNAIKVVQTTLTVFTSQLEGPDWTCLYAASMVSMVFPLALFLPLQKFYVQGVTSSGVKG